VSSSGRGEIVKGDHVKKFDKKEWMEPFKSPFLLSTYLLHCMNPDENEREEEWLK
jgi:hypothetical protein